MQNKPSANQKQKKAAQPPARKADRKEKAGRPEAPERKRTAFEILNLPVPAWARVQAPAEPDSNDLLPFKSVLVSGPKSEALLAAEADLAKKQGRSLPDVTIEKRARGSPLVYLDRLEPPPPPPRKTFFEKVNLPLPEWAKARKAFEDDLKVGPPAPGRPPAAASRADALQEAGRALAEKERKYRADALMEAGRALAAIKERAREASSGRLQRDAPAKAVKPQKAAPGARPEKGQKPPAKAAKPNAAVQGKGAGRPRGEAPPKPGKPASRPQGPPSRKPPASKKA
jgi:hypothetical protein